MNLNQLRYFCALSPPARSQIVLLAAIFMLPYTALGASLICHWIDEEGHTQFGDIIPHQYASVAVCTDSKQYELTAEQKKEAQERKAAEQAKALTDQATQPNKTDSRKSRPSTAKAKTVMKRPIEVITDATDCPTRWRIYDESAACFGPFKTVRGIKSEAYDSCNEVPNPEPKCGLRSN
jgi:hypothetical protein